jgi:probable addiction module antidote protein
MPKRTTDFREDLLADLADPQEAAHYLNAAFEDSTAMVLVALRDVAEARQMARVAEGAGVAREALYRMLRKSGNPTYNSLVGVLNAVGLRIVFEPNRFPGDLPCQNKSRMPAPATEKNRPHKAGAKKPGPKKRG